jgi:hypothetical protein
MKKLFIVLALGFALAADGSSHGTGWVITQVAHRLGITKDWMELTPSDIDKLSNKQACGLAKIIREMWGSRADEFRHDEDKNKGLAAIKTKNCRDYLKQASVIFAEMNSQADTAFFSGVHLGMTIDEAGRQKADDVAMLWHSDAPPGQEQVDFRNRAVPQRRIYVYYSLSDNKIVSVSYWKLGEGETFSKAEQDHLVKLNGDPKELKVTLLDQDYLEITTPKQFKIEAANHQ